jgi:hypothetical protein
MRRPAVLLLVALLVAGCGDKKFGPPGSDVDLKLVGIWKIVDPQQLCALFRATGASGKRTRVSVVVFDGTPPDGHQPQRTYVVDADGLYKVCVPTNAKASSPPLNISVTVGDAADPKPPATGAPGPKYEKRFVGPGEHFDKITDKPPAEAADPGVKTPAQEP